jgi:hypothetical protein
MPIPETGINPDDPGFMPTKISWLRFGVMFQQEKDIYCRFYGPNNETLKCVLMGEVVKDNTLLQNLNGSDINTTQKREVVTEEDSPTGDSMAQKRIVSPEKLEKIWWYAPNFMSDGTKNPKCWNKKGWRWCNLPFDPVFPADESKVNREALPSYLNIEKHTVYIDEGPDCHRKTKPYRFECLIDEKRKNIKSARLRW